MKLKSIAMLICKNFIKKFGHLSENNVKRLVREKLILGTGVSYEQIKDERLDKCIACYKGKIKANSTENHNFCER